MKKITLLLIVDNPLMRDGIISILRLQKYYVLGISSKDRNNILLKINVFKPDAILLDLGLQRQNSLNLIKIIKKDFPAAKIIIMNLAPMLADIPEYVKAGVSGFIRNDATLNDFATTINGVVEGSNVFPRLLVNSLFSQIVENAIDQKKSELMHSFKMTRREKKIIKLLSEGLDNREISSVTHSSIQDVISQINNIMEKLALYMCLETAGNSTADQF